MLPRGRVVGGVRQLGRPDGCARTLRRGLLHRLGRHRRADPLARCGDAASVRVNIEADSVNSALLLEGRCAGQRGLRAARQEVAREMTQKSGQKCTAIRRVFVPGRCMAPPPRRSPRGWPRPASATRATRRCAWARWSAARSSTRCARASPSCRPRPRRCTTAPGTRWWMPMRRSPAASAPTLLGTRNAAGSDAGDRIHDTEVFGPVATLVPYRDAAHAQQLIARGQGARWWPRCTAAIPALRRRRDRTRPLHGRVHVISRTSPRCTPATAT